MQQWIPGHSFLAIGHCFLAIGVWLGSEAGYIHTQNHYSSGWILQNNPSSDPLDSHSCIKEYPRTILGFSFNGGGITASLGSLITCGILRSNREITCRQHWMVKSAGLYMRYLICGHELFVIHYHTHTGFSTSAGGRAVASGRNGKFWAAVYQESAQ